MAQEAYARNLFGNKLNGDLSLVTFSITASASAAPPNGSISAGAAGVYTCTMPASQTRVCIAREVVDAGAKTVVVSGFTTSNGVTTFTLTFSGGSNVTGVEEAHVAFLCGAN